MPGKFVFRKLLLSIIPFRLVYFFKKKLPVNYLLFGKANRHEGNYLLDEMEDRTTVLCSMNDELGRQVASGFSDCYKIYFSCKGFLRRYILEVPDCIIEPEYGWGITAQNDRLVFDSISNNTWRETYHPSYRKYKREKDKAIRLDSLISINLIPGGEDNYWHFLHDLLGQVALARHTIKGELSFLISRRLSEKKYFKDALAISTCLSDCNWVIRDDCYYRVGRAYFLQTMPNSNQQFFQVKELLGIKDSPKGMNRKVFLTRSRKRIRFLRNSKEIESLAAQHGFEIIDADGLSLQEQIHLFGETRYLVGIHGAGLTNVIYRQNAPLHLFELLPADYLQPHYFWISKGMEHDYSCLVGSSSYYDTSFYIDPSEFEKKLVHMLNPVNTREKVMLSFQPVVAAQPMNTTRADVRPPDVAKKAMQAGLAGKGWIAWLIPYKIARAIKKYGNLNVLFFSYAAEASLRYVVENVDYVYRFYNMTNVLGPKVASGFWEQMLSYIKPRKLQREYIINGGKCYIEPDYGWGIQFGSNRLIRDSVTYNRHLENYHPSYFKYKFLDKSKVRHLPRAVSIRMITGAEKNYWHFLSDMLGVLVLIDKHNFSRDIPLVITKKLADQKFFQQVIAYSPDLQSRNWVIQDKEYILADEVFFCQKMPNQKDQFTGLLELLNIPDADKRQNRRIYVSRSPQRIRFIKNDHEIQAIAKARGFEIVDCDNLSFSEQVALFSSCSHVIGIHGAGLTNIVWRKNAPLTLLELFPANYVHPGYFWLAKSFDKEYFALTGSNILPGTSFHINPEEFEAKLDQMLASGE